MVIAGAKNREGKGRMATTDLVLGFGVLGSLKVKEIEAVCLSPQLPRDALFAGDCSLVRQLPPGLVKEFEHVQLSPNLAADWKEIPQRFSGLLS